MNHQQRHRSTEEENMNRIACATMAQKSITMCGRAA
jgi:hypothetical protein